MVKPGTLLLAALSVLPAFTTAKACTEGLDYCGYNLLNKGKYLKEIYDELKKNGKSLTVWNTDHSLFHCGSDGWIVYRGICDKGCHDRGNGKSDTCWD